MDLPSTSSLQQAINSNFKIQLESEQQIQLTEVNITTSSDASDFENISLIFSSSNFFDQGAYELNQQDLGSLLLLLVPVGQQEDTYTYEALINRKVE